MKLAYPELEQVLTTEKTGVQTLVVEQSRFFREIIADIYNQVKGNSGRWILSKDEKPIDFSKNVEVIDNIIAFDINSKTLLTKIMSAIEVEALDSENYLKTNELL